MCFCVLFFCFCFHIYPTSMRHAQRKLSICVVFCVIHEARWNLWNPDQINQQAILHHPSPPIFRRTSKRNEYTTHTACIKHNKSRGQANFCIVRAIIGLNNNTNIFHNPLIIRKILRTFYSRPRYTQFWFFFLSAFLFRADISFYASVNLKIHALCACVCVFGVAETN